jgi:hypothetical protein
VRDSLPHLQWQPSSRSKELCRPARAQNQQWVALCRPGV